MDIEFNINQARQVFDQDLHTAAYDRLLADADHLNALIHTMTLQPGKHYLDIGTGNGFIAFELARQFPDSFITGLDITPNAIRTNQARQQELGLSRLDFKLFDGLQYPFEKDWFDGAVIRYAFHHFPDAIGSLKELHRILGADGFIIVSDPYTIEDDPTSFIDDFQKLRPDGHIHFYKPQEIITLFRQQGFITGDAFTSRISYPRDLTPDYTRLLESTSSSILQKYRVEIKGAHVYVTVPVMNIRFRKST